MSEGTLDTIRRRRTMRDFAAGDVTTEQVDQLLELAMCAPSRLNRQPSQFVVIRDRSLQRELAELLRIHPYIEAAPVVVAVCGVPQLSPTWAMDISAAIENMLIGATALGLGSAWVGAPDTVMWSMCEELLHDALAIPADVRIAALVALGYPARDLPPHGREDRFDPVKVHYGKWGARKLG